MPRLHMQFSFLIVETVMCKRGKQKHYEEMKISVQFSAFCFAILLVVKNMFLSFIMW